MIWAITQQSEVTIHFFPIDTKDVDAALRDIQRTVMAARQNAKCLFYILSVEYSKLAENVTHRQECIISR